MNRRPPTSSAISRFRPLAISRSVSALETARGRYQTENGRYRLPISSTACSFFGYFDYRLCNGRLKRTVWLLSRLGAILMHRQVCSVIAATLLCGCAMEPPAPEWMKGGVAGGPPGSQLEVDVHVCQRWSPSRVGRIDPEGFRACMIALGWTPTGSNDMLPSGQVAQQ
jgi:hypothetical protein